MSKNYTNENLFLISVQIFIAYTLYENTFVLTHMDVGVFVTVHLALRFR
jgi:hypothetical protein